MGRNLRAIVVAAGLMAAPVVAQAQMGAMPMHEFGVDLGIVYSHIGSGCSTNCGLFNVMTPVDVRVGFVSSGAMMLEARTSFSFSSQSGVGSSLVFDPGLNVLFKLGTGTGHHNMMGPYVTVGADASIQSNSPTGGPSTSGVLIGINGGIGTRIAYGSGATRLEGFVRYQLKNSSIFNANLLQIGARIGLSLWH